MRDAARRTTVALLVLAAVLLAAAPASAIIVKLPGGKKLSYEPLVGKAPQPLLRRPHDAALSNLDYSGGPVMPSNVNYVIDWQPAGYAGAPHLSDSTASHGYVYGVAQFFKDLQAASGTNTNSDSISSQYNDASGNTAAYSSQLASGGNGTNGAYLDSDALPPNGCSEGTYCITDKQLQNELATFIAARGLPTDLTHEYFVLTPPSVVTCFDAQGTQCSGNAMDNSAKVFCGYHSASSTSSPLLYADIPDLDSVRGCDPFSTTGLCATTYVCDYNGTYAEGMLSTVAHEHNESITDPEPNNAWTDWQQCSQGAPETCGGEIGDKCSGDQDLDPNNNYQVGLAGLGTAVPFNETINGRRYWLQMEWSNQGAACADSLSQLGGLQSAPGASFTVRGDQTTANTDLLDATGSGSGISHYVWQFNDGQGGTQNTTVETSTPTVTHTFPAAGTYTVALTTMAANGRSEGTTVQTVAAGLTTAAFQILSTGASDRTPVSFSAASTSVGPGVGVSSYSWNFGDGSAPGSGVRTSHTFTPGAHTVTLTVTDTLGRTSTATNSVAVVDLPPAATFRAPFGKAGKSVSFSGRGTDDEAIVSYLWRFGDGGMARTARAKHTFKQRGKYLVTLTVTDASGLSAAVSHVVTITSLPRKKRKR